MLHNHTLDTDHLRRLATRLFTDGQYRDADQVLAELAELNEDNPAQIALRRAQIGMLSDRMDDVAVQLEIARADYGRHVYFVGLEADMAVRKGDLAGAAHALRLLGRHARAQHLDSFDGCWYQVQTLSDQAVPWDDEHALPLCEISINGTSGRFVLDTGTGDCLLDRRFAERAGIAAGWIDQAGFAGGKTGHWQLARIDQLCLGASCFTQMPAMVASLDEAFSHGYEKAVDGIIGAGLLRAAGGIDIDYARQHFRLGPPGLTDSADLWIAGSHYPLTSCRVNAGPNSSWFVDSGMSGMDLACSESAARRHGAQHLGGNIEALGGGGSMGATSVRLHDFQHADLEYPSLPAAILPGFTLGRELGLRIGGIIGHDWLSRHRLQLDYQSMQISITA